jgi:hypothetical protein
MATTSVVKKKRGPAPTGKGVQVGERWQPSELAAIDAWIATSADKTLTRSHAIRRLVALGLRAPTNTAKKRDPDRTIKESDGTVIPSPAKARF